MWSQNWQLYQPLIDPFGNVDLNANLKRKNWTTLHIVQQADDFCSSMGLPAMPVAFWKHSVFEKNANGLTKCHGSAANMYTDKDYRYKFLLFVPLNIDSNFVSVL